MLAVRGLINYFEAGKAPHLAHVDVDVERFHSVLYLPHVDVSLMRDFCSLIAYVLRSRFGVRPRTEAYPDLDSFDDYQLVLYRFMRRLRVVQQLFSVDLDEFARDESSSMSRDTRRDLVRFLKIRDLAFEAFMEVFDDEGKLVDAENVYARMFLDATLSDTVPLVVSDADVDTLPRAFDTWCRLAVHSLDYANSLHFVVLTFGVLLSTLLVAVTRGKFEGDEEAWAKLRLDPDTPAWMVVEHVRDDFRHELFDPSSGDVFLDCNDYLATLIAQGVSRAFARFLEWPLRNDVKSYLQRYILCDNMHRFFHEHGRSQQRWIHFRKRRRDDDDERSEARIFVRLEPLIALYDDLVCSLPVATTTTTTTAAAATHQVTQLTVNKASVKQQFDSLSAFHRDYLLFWENGVNDEFRLRLADQLRDFVKRTGGFVSRGKNDNVAVDLDDDVLFNGEPLLPSTRINLVWWLRQTYHRIFPYNYVMSSGHTTLDANVLRDCMVAQIGAANYSAKRRFTSSKARRLLDFAMRARSDFSFVVTQTALISFLARLNNECDVLHSLVGEFSFPATHSSSSSSSNDDEIDNNVPSP